MSQCIRIKPEEVYAEGLADDQQLLCVDGGFEEYLLNGTRVDMDTFGKPLVGVSLSPKFFPDNLSNVYMHKKPRVFFVGTRGSGLPIPQTKKLAITHERLASILRYSKYEMVQISSATVESKNA